MLPESRDAYTHLYDRNLAAERRVNERKRRYANRKAKALLHRHLTKEQRWELRATKSIMVTGQDGRDYLITEGTCNNVFLMKDGEKRFRLCAVANLGGNQALPVHDLMLAQKLTIESNIRRYLSMANAMNVKTGHAFPGRLLLEDIWPDEIHRNMKVENSDIRDRVPDDVLDEPEEWLIECISRAETFRRTGNVDGNSREDQDPA